MHLSQLENRVIGGGETESSLSWLKKSDFEALVKVLDALGPVPTLEELNAIVKSEHKSIDFQLSLSKNIGSKVPEFIRQQSKKDHTDTLAFIQESRVFYVVDKVKDSRPVFYFNLCKITTSAVDMSSFLYCLVNQIQQIAHPIDLVVDFTFASLVNEWPNSILDTFEKSIPKIQIHNGIFLNVSSHAKSNARRFMRLINNRNSKKLVAVNSLSELKELIHPDNLQILESTREALELESKIYSPLNQIMDKSHAVPINVGMSSKFLTIYNTRKQDIFGANGFLVDYFLFEDISFVRKTASHGDNEEGVIHFKESSNFFTQTLHLEWPKGIKIVDLINHHLSRIALSQSSNDRKMNADDIKAAILNTALLNLLNDDPILRMTSYHLLSATCQAYQYQDAPVFAPNIAVPYNAIAFARDMSARIALQEVGLTFEFLREALASWKRASSAQRYHGVQYALPWIGNLETMVTPNDSIRSASDLSSAQSQVTDVLDLLLLHTMQEIEVAQFDDSNRLIL